MKYAKQWDAGDVHTSWSKTDKEEYFAVHCAVIRPGTSDNMRPIRLKMSRENFEYLRDSITKHLDAHPKK